MSTWMTYWFFLLSPGTYSARQRVLLRLLENGLFCQGREMRFHAQSVPFLGFINFVQGAAYGSWQNLACGRIANLRFTQALERFLGFSNLPWHPPRTAFRWSSAAHAAFTNLKSHFVSAPILITPDTSRQFVVEVNTSEVGVGVGTIPTFFRRR